MKSPSIVTHSLLVVGLVIFTSCHRASVETKETPSTNEAPTEKIDASSGTKSAAIQQTDTLDSPQRREAVAYAAQHLPIAIQMPVVVLSASLKKNGFTVTQWPTKERSSLLKLVEAKNWGDALDLVGRNHVEDRKEVEDILANARLDPFRPRIAILSPNVKSPNTDDNKERLLDISMVALPNIPSDLFHIDDGFVAPLVPGIELRYGEVLKEHPSEKGFAAVVDERFTYYVFRDVALRTGSDLIREAGQKYEEEVKALNAKKALAPMSNADFMTQATAVASKYMKTVAKLASDL